MAQRRKKSTTFQKQKIAQAQYKNEFLRKLKHAVDSINGEEIFSRVPGTIVQKLYNRRIRAFKIIASPDCSVPSCILNEVRQMVLSHAKTKKINVIPGKLEVTLDEFFTVILTISLTLPDCLSEDSPVLKSLKEKINDFNTSFENILKNATGQIHSVLLAVGLYYNEIGKTLYWLNHEFKPCPGLEKGVEKGLLDNLISINTYKIESTSIIIDAIPRPVIRMGYVFPDFGIDWISFKPSDLKLENCFSDIPIDVYIQSHAIQRLSERIDCFPAGTVYYNLFISLKFPEVFYDFNHKILIEFRYLGTKAGYFRVELAGEKFVIKTFLFVTNNGTPEGQMLENITGLQKLDKKYLALDKLSTFMTSDIGGNEKVKEIFTSAGCQCLLELYEKSQFIATNTPKQFDAELMLKYINFEGKLLPESKQHKALHRLKPQNI